MRYMLLCLAAYLGINSTVLADPSDAGTVGLDGQSWRLFDRDPVFQHANKMLVIRGILDGLLLGRSPDIDPGYRDRLITSKGYEDLVMALDRFYGDPQNDHIPIVFAITAISRRPQVYDKLSEEIPLESGSSSALMIPETSKPGVQQRTNTIQEKPQAIKSSASPAGSQRNDTFDAEKLPSPTQPQQLEDTKEELAPDRWIEPYGK